MTHRRPLLAYRHYVKPERIALCETPRVMWHAHDPDARAAASSAEHERRAKKNYAWAMFQGEIDAYTTVDSHAGGHVGEHVDDVSGGHVDDVRGGVGAGCGSNAHGAGGNATRVPEHLETGAQRTKLTIHSLMHDLVDGMFSYVAGMRNPQTKYVMELARQADPDDIDMDVYCPGLHLTLGQIGALKMQQSKLASRRTRQNAAEKKMQRQLLQEAGMESAGVQECGEPTGAH